MMNTSTPSLDDQSLYYDERWEREAQRPLSGIRLTRAAAILHEMSRLRLERPRILDFGCGTGNFTGMLSHIGEVVGVELSPHAMELARSRMPHIDFRAGDVFEVGLEEASFDVVILQEVIEHVEDQATLIERCRSLLKPSGYLILTTPNKTITHRAGVYEKAKREGTLQPIENLLTVSQTRQLVANYLKVVRCHTIIPVGHNGVFRILNAPRLTRFAVWRGVRSCLPVGLHTVVVGQRK